MLKADDLLAMNSSEPRESSTTSISLRPAENRRPTTIVSTSKYVFEFSCRSYYKVLYF
jgi:hypothetical protein